LETKKKFKIAIVISNREGFKPKLVRRDKESNYKLIAGIIHQQEML
jgi:hypothetical protein